MQLNGSILVMVAETKEEALERVHADVYYKTDVWDKSKVSTSNETQMYTSHWLHRFRSSLSKPLFASRCNCKLPFHYIFDVPSVTVLYLQMLMAWTNLYDIGTLQDRL